MLLSEVVRRPGLWGLDLVLACGLVIPPRADARGEIVAVAQPASSEDTLGLRRWGDLGLAEGFIRAGSGSGNG